MTSMSERRRYRWRLTRRKQAGAPKTGREKRHFFHAFYLHPSSYVSSSGWLRTKPTPIANNGCGRRKPVDTGAFRIPTAETKKAPPMKRSKTHERLPTRRLLQQTQMGDAKNAHIPSFHILLVLQDPVRRGRDGQHHRPEDALSRRRREGGEDGVDGQRGLEPPPRQAKDRLVQHPAVLLHLKQRENQRPGQGEWKQTGWATRPPRNTTWSVICTQNPRVHVVEHHTGVISTCVFCLWE